MKKFKLLIIGFLALLTFSCDTEIVEAIDEFSFEQGGYMRSVTPIPFNNTVFKVSIANLTGTKLETLLEAVTPNKGANFASYEMLIKFEDKTAANGNKSTTDKAFKTLNASQFTADATTGYPRFTLSITGKEALDATGLTAAYIAAGDYFTVTATMVLKDGKKFNAANTGGDILTGAFYNSPFVYRINVIN